MFPSLAITAIHQLAGNAPTMDRLMLTGFIAMFAMLTSWPYARRSLAAATVFVTAALAISVYSFELAAWPAGIVAIGAAFSVGWSHTGALRTALDRRWRRMTIGRLPIIVHSAGGRITQLIDPPADPDSPSPTGRHPAGPSSESLSNPSNSPSRGRSRGEFERNN